MMRLLHNIGPRVNSNYNTREEIAACKDVLGFDGVYKSVLRNADILAGKKVVLFVMGNYVGKDNSFDVGMPREEYCSWEELDWLCERLGAQLGWHTWSHPNLTLLSDAEVIREITPPPDRPMKLLAYPYGNVDARVARLAQEAGFEAAWSVTQGDGSQWQQKRPYLNW